jgi:hypothetical protein
MAARKTCELIVEAPLAENEPFQVFGGETAWEESGFLALVRASSLEPLWLIHSSCSEPFREAQITSEVIIAVSWGYPFLFRWTIPIFAPNWLTVASERH